MSCGQLDIGPGEEGGVTYWEPESQGLSQDLIYHVAQAQGLRGHSTILLSAGRGVATEPLLTVLNLCWLILAEPLLKGERFCDA